MLNILKYCRATFDPTDDLIMSDGVLWDYRAPKEIHKFDKLNQTLSGVFHPNGLEIISNTEVGGKGFTNLEIKLIVPTRFGISELFIYCAQFLSWTSVRLSSTLEERFETDIF